MEPMIPPPFEETIAELGNSDQPLLSSRLAELSNLSSEELEIFKQTWATIELNRRRQIVHRLVELAEENFELDFDNIFKNCLGDPDAEVRVEVIEGLWENEEPSLINPLINLLEQDSSEEVQAAAATALGKFVMLAEHDKLRSSHMSKVCQALLATIGDKSKPIEVTRYALEAAAPINHPEVERAITEAYQSHNFKLKVSSIYAMGKSCDPTWLPILLNELDSADAEIRYEAAGACGELGEEEAVTHLVKLINDPDTDVQMAAVQALGKIGGTDAKNCLEQCLDDPNEAIQEAAEGALRKLDIEENPLSF
jgi:HEAT repeat protein